MLGFLRGSDLAQGAIAPIQGQHSLDNGSIFKKSDAGAITPDSPGKIFDSYRSMPAHNSVRPFSEEEADALSELAKETKRLAKSTKRATQAIAKISKSDRKINLYNQQSFRQQAQDEARIQSHKATTARSLHGLRPKYAAMGMSVQQAAASADQAIAALSASL